jgi:hypothetical protein
MPILKVAAPAVSPMARFFRKHALAEYAPPAPQLTDPNGQACDSFDTLGCCPGDDPTPMQNWCAATPLP